MNILNPFVHLSKRLLFCRWFSSTLNPESQNVSSKLIDMFGRKHNYLRISLTERCNFRCVYCMPEEGVQLTHNDKLLSTNEIIRLVKLFASLGVNKIRFTGGEPLLRKDLTEIIGEVSKVEGIKTVAMTTNGFVLQRKIEELHKAGLNALNISLDTLIPHKFEYITHLRALNAVLKSINSALSLGFNPVKINCVVMKGFNEDELTSFVNMTKSENLDIRFIEYMPFDGNNWETDKMVPYAAMLEKIREVFPDLTRVEDAPNDTSKAYKVPGFQGQIGFITSMSENFCGTCNRLRIAADGSLKVCLFGNEEVSLRDAVRQNHSDEELTNLIASAVLSKKKQHAGMLNLSKMENRPMILIGEKEIERLDNVSLPHRNYTASSNKYYSSKNTECSVKTFEQNIIHSMNENVILKPSKGRVMYVTLSNNMSSFRNCSLFHPTVANSPMISSSAGLRTNYHTACNQTCFTAHFSSFAHTDQKTGKLKMVDVSNKDITHRTAMAEATISLGSEVFQLLLANKLQKGDVLPVAKLAGIAAAKKTSDIIPLCHQVRLDWVDVELNLVEDGHRLVVRSHVKTSDRTGVEMEALTAASVAALAAYDMCKSVTKDMEIVSIKLLKKTGGRSDFSNKNQETEIDWNVFLI